MFLDGDRHSVCVWVVIVRGLCDTWIKIHSGTFVTDEQNALSLWSSEHPVNLVPVDQQKGGKKGGGKFESEIHHGGITDYPVHSSHTLGWS